MKDTDDGINEAAWDRAMSRDVQTKITRRRTPGNREDVEKGGVVRNQARGNVPAGAVSSLADEVGLSVDMLDVDRLRVWATNVETYGSELTQWCSTGFVVEWLRGLAARLETTVRDIGVLRKERDLLRAALSDVIAQFDAGYFVRNTDSDGCSDWAMKAAEPLRALAVAKKLLTESERTTSAVLSRGPDDERGTVGH